MRYWDNPENWSTPGVRDEYLQREFPGRGKKIMKTVPLPDEYEIYDLSTDPLEKNNLARSSDPTVLRIRKQLEQLLAEEKKKKRISRFKSPKPSSKELQAAHHYKGDIRLLMIVASIIISVPTFTIGICIMLSRLLKKIRSRA
eukprot:TRINITY_DN2510_c0_g1_i3.p1 TRINITY_DN2510_c0_g1~~TRINITY_DN2510_c0_g1_i3.p1  ORF type:complete len:143 (+),score=36.04 TRINITY_DN2510_c0_g1_i3:272-700(+)